ncbi:MAG: glycosyltransferase family 8 protein [Dehalococcoidia bacterium]
MQIVCAVEGDSYLRHSAAMLHSLLSRHPEGVQVEYLHGDDTSRRGRKRLASMVQHLGSEVTFHRVNDSWTEGFPIKGFTRKATWYRICLDALLPAVQRVIWLDVDLLVLDSLRPLWDTSLNGHVLGAVTNVPPGPDRAYTERPELGGDPYFNAGVLLLDLALMRETGLGSRLREFTVANAARLHWRDQDALNEVLHDRRLALHPRWNCMNAMMQFDYAVDYFGVDDVSEACSSPAIRHFEGPLYNKPWHLLADRHNQSQYLQHRRRTPWPRMRRTGCTPMNLMRYARRRLA